MTCRESGSISHYSGPQSKGCTSEHIFAVPQGKKQNGQVVCGGETTFLMTISIHS